VELSTPTPRERRQMIRQEANAVTEAYISQVGEALDKDCW
jgi:hypothetical protein